jgi:hypothetical protein
MNKKIVRVEHADGWGMFRWNRTTSNLPRYVLGVSSETEAMSNLHNDLPTPFRDKGINGGKYTTYDLFDDVIMKDRFCAYKNLESFYQWIVTEELKFLLTNHDFKVLLIEVKEYLEGECQVLYRKEDIVHVEDISSLFLD